MQKQNNSKRYIFDAHAAGVSGRIVNPYQHIIEVQAASALPATGGFSSARVEGFRHKEVLSFASAYTEVVGRETTPGVFETVTFSVVEKFNLLDVITCDRIVSRLTSKNPGGGKLAPTESAILPHGSRFEGLRVANEHFPHVEVAPALFSEPEVATWSGLLQALDDKSNSLRLKPLLLSDGREDVADVMRRGRTAGVLGFSIALGKSDEANPLGKPLSFEVPQFGTVHLGEYFCFPTARHLTMLRVELGCPMDGDIMVGDAIVDGDPYPPS